MGAHEYLPVMLVMQELCKVAFLVFQRKYEWEKERRKRTKYEKENLSILNISASQGKINVLGLAKGKEKSYLFL